MQTKEVLVEEIKPLAASTPSPKVKKEKSLVESSTTTSKESSLDALKIKKPPTYALIVKEEKVSSVEPIGELPGDAQEDPSQVQPAE